MLDKTKRPLQIPPDFAKYAEKHGIFDLYENLLQRLVVEQPADPLAFMIKAIRQPIVPRVIVHGPPAAGKDTVCAAIEEQLGIVHISASLLAENAIREGTQLGLRAKAAVEAGEPIPAQVMVGLIVERISAPDCINHGWILQGFPRTRDDALALQAGGVLAKHVISLELPRDVCGVRTSGRRVQPGTGRVYHNTFNPPPQELADLLTRHPDDVVEGRVDKRWEEHVRCSPGILQCYSKAKAIVNADQPLRDVFAQVKEIVLSRPASRAPTVVRAIFYGPPGSGKKTQARLFAAKYGIVHVSTGTILKQEAALETSLGEKIKPFVDENMRVPDDLVVPVVKKRLQQKDCMARGFIIEGFPRDAQQLGALRDEGIEPNRAIFFDIPDEIARERLQLRRMDPQTGAVYHLLDNPPQSEEVRGRLVRHPKDADERVAAAFNDYHLGRDDLLSALVGVAQHVNAAQESHAIFEKIESMLIKPTPMPPPVLQEED